MAFERGTDAPCYQGRLATLNLRAYGVKTYAGEWCQKNETTEHCEHEPLTSTRPREQTNDRN